VTDHKKVRVLLVEDHTAFRQALESVFALEPDVELVAEADRGDGIAEVAAASAPDVAVVDLDLPGASGIDVVAALRAMTPPVDCLVLTALRDPVELGRAVEAGAAGVLHKSIEITDLIAAIRDIADGRSVLDPQAVAPWLRALAEHRRDGWLARVSRDALTARELDVLTALVSGSTVAEIADDLGIATDTVETHLRNLRGKLGAATRLEAVLTAIRLGLVDPPGDLPETW
jgi:two-component system response regulator DesR